MIPRALVVEDDPELSHLIARILQRTGVDCTVVDGLTDAEACLAAEEFDALVVDRGLPDGDGATFIADLRARGVSTPAVLMSGTPQEIPDARTRFLQKPFSIDALPMLLATMVSRR